MLSEAEMTAWWNGYLALWHPAVLPGLAEPPKQASQYDHEMPTAGHIYSVPDAPALYLPEDWRSRVEQATALEFTATADRAETLSNLKKAYSAFDSSPEGSARINLPAERVRPFLAIGFGYLAIESLFDAMQHEHLLASGDFWKDVQNAVQALADPDPSAFRSHLQLAADKLMSAREVLYPVAIHLIDIVAPNDQKLGETLPKSFNTGMPLNMIVSGVGLERIRDEHPNQFAEIKDRIADPTGVPTLELCVGAYREREDAILPVESQLWNMRTGRQKAKELLGADVRVFARRRGAWSPQTPQFLLASGFEKAVLLALDGSVIPSHRSTVVSWSSPDGKQIDAFARAPLPAHQSQTFFNLVHTLHETIMQDSAATLALLHSEAQPSPCYFDWLELSKFAPILGTWTTVSRYLSESSAGEYAPASTPDDFFSDYLEERATARLPDVVSGFSLHLRQRRRLDAAYAYLAMLKALGAGSASESAESARRELERLESKLEGGPPGSMPDLAEAEQVAARLLADRLQSRAAENTPGFMFLNPCSFARRMSVELEGLTGPVPTEGPVKAVQIDPDMARIVVELPAFGFAWIPRSSPGAAIAKPRVRLAENNVVRNEYFEAEIDPASGGLKAFRDTRSRINRFGEQLVFNPGSRMLAKSVKVTVNGPALGEVTAEGALLNEHNAILATFRQRFRAWLGRPLLDMHIEIYPEKPPEGSPWHAFYAARFAWRDERATMLRGTNCGNFITNHTRPVTPEFLEVRTGQERATLFPFGLPFLQRHGGRMVDLILVPDGEQSKVFEIALGFDRDYPAQTALGLSSPTTVVPTIKGPPHIGPSGWLFHLDAPNLVMTSLRPASRLEAGSSGIELRLLEANAFGGAAELRCARDPVRAYTIDPQGNALAELNTNGDAVALDALASDLLNLRVEFP
jgi:hypothetical protein